VLDERAPQTVEETEMEWTAEADGRLRELHAKRVSLLFIANWMRWPAPEVRARLITLGLAKSLSSRSASYAPVAVTSGSLTSLQAAEICDEAFDDEVGLKKLPDCPRGHLLSEANIAALYRGRGYRR
jgi:hypothetical protein